MKESIGGIQLFLIVVISFSLSICILYLNYFEIGYNFFEYVNFIIRRIECLNFIFGVIFMILSSFIGGKNNELYL